MKQEEWMAISTHHYHVWMGAVIQFKLPPPPCLPPAVAKEEHVCT